MSHSITVGSTDQIAAMVAYDSADGSVKTDLVAADIVTLIVTRVGATDVSIASPTNKTNPNDAHSDGAVFNDGGGDYLVDLPDAAVATQVGSIRLDGTWSDAGDSTSGVLVGYRHPIVAYSAADGDDLGLSHLAAIPDNPMLATEDGSSFAAIPDMATLAKQEEIIGDIATAQTAIDAIPTNPMLDTEDGSSFGAIPDMATATNQAAIAGYIDTEVAAILAGLTSGIIVLHADYDAAKTASQASTMMALFQVALRSDVDTPLAATLTALNADLGSGPGDYTSTYASQRTASEYLAEIPTVTEFNARTLPSADYFDPAADPVANVTLVATTTTLTNLPAITTNWLTAAGLASDAVSEIQSGLATAANLATVAGYLDTEIAAILADTNELQTNQGNWLTADVSGLSTHSAADVRTELATELARIDVATSTRQATVPNLANVVTMAAQFSTMIIVNGSVYDFTAAALAAGSGGDATVAKQNEIIADIAAMQEAVDLLAGAAGPGGIAWEVTVNDSEGDPIGDVGCWVSTDSAGTNVIAGTLYTTEFGIVTFMLNAGTYYLWRNSTSHDFTNPTVMTVA